MRSIKQAALIVIIGIAITGILSEYSSAQVLKGVIIDNRTGDPVANAKVLLSHAENDSVMYGVRADKKGRFDATRAMRLAKMKGGEQVSISIVARGYKPYEELISVPYNAIEDEYRLKPASSAKADLPIPRRIWIKAWLIEASGEGDGKAKYPEEIEPIVEDLKNLFRFNSYRIIGRADAMGMEGSTLVFDSNTIADSECRFEVFANIGYGNGFIKLSQFSIHVQKPVRKAINTTLNIPEGEMVILGASRGDAAKGSLISVVSAHVVKASH